MLRYDLKKKITRNGHKWPTQCFVTFECVMKNRIEKIQAAAYNGAPEVHYYNHLHGLTGMTASMNSPLKGGLTFN